MRYRLMASYLGASYQAAVGPSDRDVTLFAAPPPPEEHAFSPAPGGIWRKQVRLDNLDALWESRPIGSYHGEPCLVLDDLGDRLHIVYLGMDQRRAAQLGYWEVDRGVFEVVVPRNEITDLAEERHEFPISLLLSSLPRALGVGGGADHAGLGGPGAGRPRRHRRPGNRPGRFGLRRQGHGRQPGARGGRPGHRDARPGRPGTQGPGSWADQAGAQRPVRGQLPAALPAAMPPQPTALGQPPLAGTYQMPGGTEQGGTGLPGAPGLPGRAGAGAPGFAPQGMAAGGQQAPGGPQLAAAGPQGESPQAPAGPLGAAAHGQAAYPQAMAGPQRPAPARPQLPAAPQPSAQQFPSAPSLSAASPALGSAGPGSQQGAQQQATLAPLPPGTAQQPLTSTVPAGQAGAQQAGQPASVPTAVTAWHGSPAADGNWYYQPPAASQNGGQQAAAPAGYQLNGFSPAGYAQPEQTTVPLATRPPGTGPTGNGTGQPPSLAGSPSSQGAAPGGLNGMQQYAPAAQPAPNGYPQALSAPLAGGQQPPFGQPNQAGPGQLGQPGQMALSAPAAPPSPTGQPSAPGPAGLQAGPAGQPAIAGQSAQPSPAVPPSLTPPSPAGTGPQYLAQPTPQAPSPAQAGLAEPMTVAGGVPPVPPPPGLTVTPPPAASLGAPPAPPAPAPAGPRPAAAPPQPAMRASAPASTPADADPTGPLATLPPPLPTAPPAPLASAAQGAHAAPTGSGTIGNLTGAVRGRRAARRPRLAMSAIFADLVDMADIPRSAYAVDEEVTGSMCLFKTDGGYEVFSCAEDARHEVRFFEEEEAAYFYLFGVLAAEALRNGRLTPRRA